MEYTKSYLGKTFLTGLVILLPLMISAIVLTWIFGIITGVLQPITNLLTRTTGIPELIGDVLVMLLILWSILMIGFAARTTIGRWLHPQIDQYMQRVAPGYSMIREIVQQLFGDRKNSPLAHGSVALIKLYGPDVEISVTAVVTSIHEDGTHTVFVPTGPNPTSGFIYHVSPELVQMRPDVRVESALRTVIACGTGAGKLFADGPPVTAGGVTAVPDIGTKGAAKESMPPEPDKE